MTAIETDLLQLAYPPQLDLGPQLTHEQLMSSMQATMGLHKGGPVWFAYGSLIGALMFGNPALRPGSMAITGPVLWSPASGTRNTGFGVCLDREALHGFAIACR